MTWAPTETQKSIFSTLSGDATLVGLLGGTLVTNPKVFDHVPDNVVFPYVTMSIRPWEDRGNATYEGLRCELQIDVWYQPGTASTSNRGEKSLQAIQARIDALLHEQEPCIEGWNVLALRRTFVDILTEPDNVTKHGIQRFKLFLGGI